MPMADALCKITVAFGYVHLERRSKHVTMSQSEWDQTAMRPRTKGIINATRCSIQVLSITAISGKFRRFSFFARSSYRVSDRRT